MKSKIVPLNSFFAGRLLHIRYLHELRHETCNVIFSKQFIIPKPLHRAVPHLNLSYPVLYFKTYVISWLVDN